MELFLLNLVGKVLGCFVYCVCVKSQVSNELKRIGALSIFTQFYWCSFDACKFGFVVAAHMNDAVRDK